jgi:uncharacterized membrane protein
MKRALVVALIFATLPIFNLAYAQDYAPESLLVTLFTDGKALIEYRLSADVTVPTITVPMFGSTFEQLTVVDEGNSLLDNRVENSSLIIDTFGASSVFITYTTSDLVSKTGRLWTFVMDAPIDTSIRLPSDSVIIGLNQIPNSIKTSDNQYVLIMPAGSTEISYVIGSLGTKEHANLAISTAERAITDYESKGIVVNDAKNKLDEAKKAFDEGKYADAERLANEAKSTADSINDSAENASKVLSEAGKTIGESRDKGFDVTNAEQLHTQAEEEYANGNYDKALNLAESAKTAALDAKNVQSGFDQMSIIAVVAASAAGAAGAAAYMRSRKKASMESMLSEPVVKEKRIININKIFTEKPYLRDDDKEAINYIAEKGGEAFESEIRERFNLPKTTVWRLVKRLEREEIVEVKKPGGQNLIRIREEFTRSDQNVV